VVGPRNKNHEETRRCHNFRAWKRSDQKNLSLHSAAEKTKKALWRGGRESKWQIRREKSSGKYKDFIKQAKRTREGYQGASSQRNKVVKPGQDCAVQTRNRTIAMLHHDLTKQIDFRGGKKGAEEHNKNQLASAGPVKDREGRQNCPPSRLVKKRA